MPLMSSGLAEIVAVLKIQVAHADRNPVIPEALNGDQNPLTVSTGDMRQVIAVLPDSPEWNYLRGLFKEGAKHPCREYPCAWIRAAIAHLES
jgi:hypothetical protein